MEEEREEVSETTETSLQNALAALEQSKREAVFVAREHAATIRDQCQTEIEGYKEQSRQHAITIVALKERLSTLEEQNEQLKNDNNSLQQQLIVSTKPPVEEEEQELKSKMKELEQLVKVLRHQLALNSKEGEKQTETICNLRKELEHQKLHKENLRTEHEIELEDIKKTLSSQESDLQRQSVEVDRLQRELNDSQRELSILKADQMKTVESMRESHETQLQTQLMETKEKWQRLIEVGERCLGDHHTQVIQRQRDTIAHLREKLQKNDGGRKPSDAGHVATLAELERVREELMEERAQRHLEASSRAGRRESDSDSAQESDPVLDALELCEESYQGLVDSVCETGLIKTVPEEKKLPVTPSPSGRQSLMEDRRMFAEKVGKKITSLRAQLDKLRKEADKDSSDIGESGQPKPDLSEEVARLQEQLETANEEIDQQKRVNLALVKRQEFREQQMKKALRHRRSKQHSSSFT